jgi:hypothetical protein
MDFLGLIAGYVAGAITDVLAPHLDVKPHE